MFVATMFICDLPCLFCMLHCNYGFIVTLVPSLRLQASTQPYVVTLHFCLRFLALPFFLPHTVNCVRFCIWRCLCLFVNQISRDRLNGFAHNSQGRRVWFLARTSLNVKVKDKGHQGPKTRCVLPSSVLLHDAL